MPDLDNDIALIEEALSYVDRPELDFIFENRSRIASTIVLTLDKRHIYAWRREQGNAFARTRFEHSIDLKDVNLGWWASGPFIKGIERNVPSNWIDPDGGTAFISGGLFTDLIAAQKQRNEPLNAYTTRESYLATIVHEFGHIYWDSFGTKNFQLRNENLEAISNSQRAFRGQNTSIEAPKNFPSHRMLGEIFAYCTDRSAAEIFWPEHLADLNQASAATLERIRSEEQSRDVYFDLSPLDRPHIAALVWGPIIMARQKKNWPRFLLGNEV